MELTVTIDGMHCGGCVASVERVLRALPGVQDVQVKVGEAKVRAEGDGADEGAVRAAREGAGLDVTKVAP